MAGYENFRNIIGECECKTTLHDLEDLFNSNFAILSRGRSRRNFLIITFPQSNYSATVTPNKLKDILEYIVSLTSDDDAKQGFVLIFDRRNDYWSTVCYNLTATIDNFPGSIQKIYVLQPTSFIQRSRIDPSLKFLHDDHKYKVLLLSSVDELHHHVDADQLTSHLSGSLAYNHQDWMLKQKTFESLAYEITALTQKLKSACQSQLEDDFPNSSGETEQLLIDHELLRADAEECFDALTNKTAAVFDDSDDGRVDAADSPKYVAELARIAESLANIITEAKKSFKSFCSKYRSRLEHCLQLRKFEEEFKQVQFVIVKYNNYLTEIQVNPDLNKSETNYQQLLSFRETSMVDIDQSKSLLKNGLEFIEGKIYASDCIKPKCTELSNMISTFDRMLEEKIRLARDSVQLLNMLDNVNKLCTEGVDLLAHQSIEDYKSDETKKISISTIDQFLRNTDAVDMNLIAKNLELFADKENNEFTKSSQQLLSKFLDVKRMCLKRKESLLNSINKKVRPVQLVVPEVSTSTLLVDEGGVVEVGGPRHVISGAHAVKAEPESRPETTTFLKKKESVRKNVDTTWYDADINNIAAKSLEPETSANSTPVKKKEGVYRNLEPGEDQSIKVKTELKPDANAAKATTVIKKDTVRHKNSSSDYLLIKPVAMASEGFNKDPNITNTNVEHRRRMIINSLRETEISYLSQLSKLKIVLENKEFCSKISNIIEGNKILESVNKIHSFHTSTISRVLMNLYQVPSLIGKHFFELEDKFQCYVSYLTDMILIEKYNMRDDKNGILLNEDELKLLKAPFKRLEIFYKSMKDFSNINDDANTFKELRLARIMLANILGIQEEPEPIESNEQEARKLILQGVFQMHVEGKKDKLKDFMSKFKPRHLFLYNNELVICKKSGNDFLTLSSLPLSAIGITENIKTDKRRFEIWLNNRSEVYSFQAQNINEKEVWITELNKILFNQFHQIKNIKRQMSEIR